MIDYIYDKIQKELDSSKQELKNTFKEAYIANYRSTVDKKSQSFL